LCLTLWHDDDNQIQIIIINEAFKYSLLLHKLNQEPIVDVSDNNIELVKSRFYSTFHNGYVLIVAKNYRPHPHLHYR
jgi:hypothetical protein